MKAIAESLVIALAYLDWRPYPGQEFLEENCDLIDMIGVDRLHFLQAYGRFMEDMVGHPWVGNRREEKS